MASTLACTKVAKRANVSSHTETIVIRSSCTRNQNGTLSLAHVPALSGNGILDSSKRKSHGSAPLFVLTLHPACTPANTFTNHIQLQVASQFSGHASDVFHGSYVKNQSVWEKNLEGPGLISTHRHSHALVDHAVLLPEGGAASKQWPKVKSLRFNLVSFDGEGCGSSPQPAHAKTGWGLLEQFPKLEKDFFRRSSCYCYLTMASLLVIFELCRNTAKLAWGIPGGSPSLATSACLGARNIFIEISNSAGCSCRHIA